MQAPGEKLEMLCKGARREITLVAPFIKLVTLRRLLESVADHVTVKCITRWRPDEIVAGVSDIEIWALIQSRPLSSLWLRTDLHAKFYRADESCLVGSANLTGAALGWSPQSNLELLLKTSHDLPEIEAFENTLFPGCVAVDDNLYRYMKGLVDEYSLSGQTVIAPVFNVMKIPSGTIVSTTTPEAWLPSLRHPETLFTAYCGNWDLLTSTSQVAAATDLEALSIPVGLTQKRFETYTAVLLLQKPIIRQIDEFVAVPRRFGAVRDLLRRLPCVQNPKFVADDTWQTLMRWLLYFHPTRYKLERPNYSEVFSKVKQ